jgi:hypothetical protein
MSPDELRGLTLTGAARLLRARKLSSTELTRACLDRIQALDGTLKAFYPIIDGCRFACGKGDILALSSWAPHEHANRSPRDAAVLFSVQDRPVLEALGLYREQALVEDGGHQAVNSTFKA